LAVAAVEVGAPSGAASILATGALKRRREMMLSFRIPGVIERLAVDEGDPVKKGQVLAALDPTTVESRVRQAKADLDRARRDLGRLSGLVERGAISRQQLDVQQNALANAEAAYQSAAFDRRWAELVSPADGVVLTRTSQAGEVVQPGQGVVSIADETSPLVLRAPLADKDAVRVRLGEPAEVTVDALPGETLPGTISRIGQQAGAASGAIEVEVTIEARPGLRSGLIAHAVISPPAASGQTFARVPAEAVLEAAGGRAFVMRLDPAGGVARRTAVTFGGFDGDDALIAGLQPSARVITAGAGYVADGQRVRLVDAARIAAGGAR
jgi:RND family efflux transporter MFP subunit